jgi:hypothetical protein
VRLWSIGALVTALSGCDKLFDLRAVAASDAATSDDKGPGVDAKICFSDDFDVGTLNASAWSKFEHPTTAVASITNKQLQITLGASPDVNNYAGIDSQPARDFTSVSIELEVVEVPAQTGGTEVVFQIYDGTRAFTISLDGGQLYFRKRVDAQDPDDGTGPVPFVPAEHRFWRLEHESGIVRYVTRSALGEAKLQREVVATDATIAAMRVGIYAGTYFSVVDPARAVFDNYVKTCP